MLMLDYDGTLTPIVNDPAKAFLPESTREMLQILSRKYTVGVVSGRSLEKVTEFVGVDDIFYAGSHGFDIRGPDASLMRHQVAMDYLPHLASARDRLAARLDPIDGAEVEDNLYSVSVHFRNLRDACSLEEVQLILREELTSFPQLRLSEGKCVYELKPDIQWVRQRNLHRPP